MDILLQNVDVLNLMIGAIAGAFLPKPVIKAIQTIFLYAMSKIKSK